MAKRKCNAGRRPTLFYSRALLTLSQEDSEPDPWIIGASVIEQRLHIESEHLIDQLQVIRQFAKQH